MRCMVALGVLAALSACGTTRAVVKTEIREVRVPVREACPDKDTYEALKASRPVPLRSQPMPLTPEERVAKSQAQLGRYESEGGWADQVGLALDRCQLSGLANPD